MQPPFQPAQGTGRPQAKTSTSVNSMAIQMEKIPGTNPPQWRVNYQSAAQQDGQQPKIKTFNNVLPESAITSQLSDIGDVDRQIGQLARPTSSPISTGLNTNPFGTLDVDTLLDQMLGDIPGLGDPQPEQLTITIDL